MPDKPTWLPFPAEDAAFSLAIAWSVFTHVNQDQAVRYLHEMRRILRPDGVLLWTWFLFDKTDFPMMQDFQNALFINDLNPTGAVIFDRVWLRKTAQEAGFRIVAATPPEIRGYQWIVYLAPQSRGSPRSSFPKTPLLPGGSHRRSVRRTRTRSAFDTRS